MGVSVVCEGPSGGGPSWGSVLVVCGCRLR